MTAEAFMDTNILLYAVSTNAAEAAKRTAARAAVRGRLGAFHGLEVFPRQWTNRVLKFRPLSPALPHQGGGRRSCLD